MSGIDRREDQGPFDIIGDVHGCTDELEALLVRLGYRLDWSGEGSSRNVCVTPPEGRKAVFVGDLVNRGPRTADALRIAMTMVAAGTALGVEGNHEAKLARALRGASAKLDAALDRSIGEIDAAGAGFRTAVSAFITSLPSHLWLDGGRLAIAHAGILEEMLGEDTDAVKAFCLYGPPTDARAPDGNPARVDWAANYHGGTTIVYGHTPMLHARWLNGTICIDTGCVAGNRLTALRWPEREIIDVPAHQIWSPLKRPLVDPGAAGAQP